LKLLYIHFHFSPPEGFGNNRSLDFCNEWAKKGVKITIFTPFRSELKTINQRMENGIEVIFPPFFRLKENLHFLPFWKRMWMVFIFFFAALWQLLRAPKPDVIYASSTPFSIGILALIIKKIRGIPYIFETIDLWPDVPLQLSVISYQLSILKLGIIRKMLYWVEKLIYKNAKSIVTLSEGMTENIIAKGILSSKILTIPNGTNIEVFKPCLNKASAKIKLGITPNEILVLYAGTIGMANGCEAILYAAKQIKEWGYTNIKFVVLGHGNRKNQLEQLYNELAIDNCKIVNAVPKNEVGKYFDAADIGLVTFAPFQILETNSANKFFDYLAAGLPTCINYEGWQKTYLHKYSCGISAPINQGQAFAKNIATLALDTQLQRTMGMNARKLAEEMFDRKKLADVIYKNLLSSFYTF